MSEDLYNVVERYQAVICEWMAANGVDPDQVPWWSVPILDLSDVDKPVLTVALYRRSESGSSRFLHPRTDFPAMTSVTVPLVVFPPRELLPWLHGQWREPLADVEVVCR